MKIGFYSPYFPGHFGGGEKHLLAMAQVLTELGHTVQLFVQLPLSSSKEFLEEYENYFGINLYEMQIIPLSLKELRAPKSVLWQRKLDALYVVSDGSIGVGFAKKNILHVQVPFTRSLSGWEKLKLKRWQVVQTNSQFTASVIERAWGRTADCVVYPCVDDALFRQFSTKKEPVILSVGRFFTQMHAKRQDVLIEAFRALVEQHQLSGWQLRLVGAVEDESYYQRCVALAKGLPVTFLTSVSRDELVSQYQKASLYWHAAGYEIDELDHPEKVEHFGISTTEAMASGCIPLVVAKGGQREVLGELLQECSWESSAELVEKTRTLINRDETNLSLLREKVMKRATIFNYEHFSAAVKKLFNV